MTGHLVGDARKRHDPDATTHARALAALDGARAAHLWPETVSDLLANALARHTGACRWHVLNEPACAAYGDALRALGIRESL